MYIIVGDQPHNTTPLDNVSVAHMYRIYTMYAVMFSGQKWVQCEIHFCDIIHTQIFTFFGACAFGSTSYPSAASITSLSESSKDTV